MSLPDVLQDIKSLKDNQLTGKYYVPGLTRVSSNTDTVTTSPLPTTWTGSSTSYTSGEYKIETSMSPQGSNPLNYAFNNNISDGFIGVGSTSAENTITITLPAAVRVVSFKTYIPDFVGLDQIFIYGSNNKSTWNQLYSGRADTSYLELGIRSLDTVGEYRYYQFRFTLDSAASVGVREIQLYEYRVTTYTNEFTILGIPNPLAINQRIMVKTPDYSNTGVTANKLNSKVVDVLLLPNRYYELVYDGTKYLAKEVI